MDGCTHDVAVGHVRGVGVVRPRRGGRIHPDASGPVRRVGRHRGGHVTRLRCRIEMDTPCLLGITRVRASCGRSSALRSHRAACRSRASCAMAEKRLSRDDRLINPRSFVDLLHWDVARDTNWDKITERRNGNQSSEGQPIFDMREFRSNKKRLSRFPPDHHPRNPTFSERSTHERIYSSEMTPFSDT